MNSPAKDFADILSGSSCPVDVVGFGTDVFVGLQPSPPLNCVTLFNTGGWQGMPNYVYEKPTVQALVRANSYSVGYALAFAIKTFLHGLCGTVINGSRYVQILAEGEIIDLGVDDTKQHYEFAVNFAAHRTPST